MVPLGQQHDEAGSEQLPPLRQQPWPQTWLPAGHVTAPPRNGFRSIAPAVAAAVAPKSFNAPRLELRLDIARVRSSKGSVITSSVP